MDKTKLNKFALQIAEDIMKARPSVPLNTAIGVANYKMANICSQLKIQIDTKAGYGKTPANIYQLLLLNSGGGKGASLGLADNFYFKDAFDYMHDVVYPKYKSIAVDQLEKEGVERPLHNWVKNHSNFTTSGLFASAESFSLCGVGGINIEVDEIGTAVVSKAELFEILLQPYDNGVFDPVGKRTDPDAITVKGLNVNLYSFGNKVRLQEGDHVETAFIKLLDEGYGRRMIFIDDKSVPQTQTPADVVNQMKASNEIIGKRVEEREYIKSLVTRGNLGKVLEFDDEALMFFATIKADGDNYIIDNKGLPPAVQSDISERSFKTAKLAGIYAFFDGNEFITEKNMEEAFEIIKSSSIVLADLRKVRPTHERLLNALLDEEKPCTSQHMLGYSFIPSSWSKKVLEIIDLSKQLASERGYLWKETSRKGVIYYEVSQKDSKVEEELDKVDEEEAKEKELSQDQEELMKLLYD